MISHVPTTQVNLPPDLIDFGIGQPGFDILPLNLIRQATAERLAAEETTLLNYGYEQGDGYFRLALAAFLHTGYGLPVDPADLLVTAGASQALDMLCTLYTQPGDVIFVEEPTYFIALRIFADHRLRIVPVPIDEQGLQPDALEDALAHHRPAFLYTIPTFQNPTGVTLAVDRRRRLVELAIAHGFMIIADEVYQLLNYTVTPPPPMAAFIESEQVISIGSFSKILAPGLRLGWLQAAPAAINRLVNGGLIYSGGSLNHFTSNIVRVALTNGSQSAYLEELRGIYRARIQVLDHALQTELSGVVRYTVPTGGYFFWLELPARQDTAALRDKARTHNVGFQPGINFSAAGGLRHFMRLSFAFYTADWLAEGVHRLASLLAAAGIHSSP